MNTLVGIKGRLAETLQAPSAIEYALDEAIDSARAAGLGSLVETEFSTGALDYALRVYADVLASGAPPEHLRALARVWYRLIAALGTAETVARVPAPVSE